MKVIVGLGNPGGQYERTRHNVGFRAAERFAAVHRIPLEGKKWHAIYGTGEAHGEKVVVILPQTFMNLSGEAVGPAMRFFKAEPADVIVLHDELDLPFGRLQLKVGGGSAGHNGLKSLVQHLGGPAFVRLRLGISRPPAGWDTANYVLGKFSGSEEAELGDLFVQASQVLDHVLQKGVLAAMNDANRKEKPGDPKPKGQKPPKPDSTPKV